MAFDLSKVMNQANEVATQQSNNEGKNQVRLIYPGTGTLKVKLLYNPKSNLVARPIRRHKIGNTNYTCLSMYGMDCPICKTVESIKNATGADLWKFNQKFRGISYVQYVGSDNYTWTQDNPEPSIGELVLLMYPWTIYQDINRIISTAGVRATEVIASNHGKILNIIRWRENSQEKYKGEIDGFNEFTSFSDNDGESKFEKFLNELPDLNEAIVPSIPDDNTYKNATDASETLSREYLRGTGYNGMSAQMNQMQNNMSGNANIITGTDGQQYILINGQYVPVATNITQVPQSPMPTPVQTNPINNQSSGFMNPPVAEEVITPNSNPVKPTSGDGTMMPECFGQHKDDDPKCMCCLHEIQCMTMKG